MEQLKREHLLRRLQLKFDHEQPIGAPPLLRHSWLKHLAHPAARCSGGLCLLKPAAAATAANSDAGAVFASRPVACHGSWLPPCESERRHARRPRAGSYTWLTLLTVSQHGYPHTHVLWLQRWMAACKLTVWWAEAREW